MIREPPRSTWTTCFKLEWLTWNLTYAPRIIRDQLQLEADAREALPYVRPLSSDKSALS
jgi:hypothetical protein